MKLFQPLYEKAIGWAAHPRAPWILAGLSFVEAIIFPVMPELMLAPMALATPKRAPWYATISLAASMVGAVVGYFLGHYAFEVLKPFFAAIGLLPGIEEGIAILQAKMVESPWAVFTFLVLGGFMPIPMKVFTWASGIVGVPMLPYLASMAVGRGKRVYLLAFAIRIGGEKAEAALRRHIEPVGWIATALLVALVAWFALRSQGLA